MRCIAIESQHYACISLDFVGCIAGRLDDVGNPLVALAVTITHAYIKNSHVCSFGVFTKDNDIDHVEL